MKNSRILEEMHSTMHDLHTSGIVDKKTMRNFDALCLKTPVMTPTRIKKIREKEHASQAVFAACLHVSTSAIKKWETGEKKPSGLASILLSIIEKEGLAIAS